MLRRAAPLLALGFAALTLGASAPEPPLAHFAWFEYQGSSSAGPARAPAGHYRNPVIAGFYPDPSIVRVGRDFYLVNSSFGWFPGIPVFHSRDLVHWKQIGNAIDRPDQLDFKGLGLSEGVFAATIRHHDGLFYIINTCVKCGGNFIITALDPAGPWSPPAWLPQVGGIDPSLFFDDDGSAWIVNNDAPPGKPLYEGHRALWLHRFDPKTLKVIGPPRLLVDGGVDPSARPIWIEGPHLYKARGRYYLMAAEGGTGTNHSEVIFRADRITGPYEPAPPSINPILTQRDLDPARSHPIASSGHADLVRLADGRWWAVFLATEPYRDDLTNTGRETFLLPVRWRDGWPVILPHHTPIPRMAKAPRLPSDMAPPTTGSFTMRTAFAGPKLAPRWVMMRTPRSRWWRLGRDGLTLEARSEGLGDHAQPSFIARRQQHADMIASTCVRFAPAADGDMAGLAAVQNDDFFLTLALARRQGREVVRIARRAGAADPAEGGTVAEKPITPGTRCVGLRIRARGGRYDFLYALAPGQWLPLARDVDGTNLSTTVAGGFTGAMIGPFAQRRPR